MSRPSRDLDKKLIAAARAMLPETGFSGLTVREVSRRAGVNVGMFHYHFKSREIFIRRLLQECYEDFFITFRDAAEGPGAPIVRLKRVLIAFARFARDNRGFYSLLVRELLNRHKGCAVFVRDNFPRHAAIVFSLMEECQRSGVVRPLPLPMLVSFAMIGMGIPNLMVAALESHGLRRIRGVQLGAFTDMMLGDDAVEARAEMVLAGLSNKRK